MTRHRPYNPCQLGSERDNHNVGAKPGYAVGLSCHGSPIAMTDWGLCRAARRQIETEAGSVEGGIVVRTKAAAVSFDNGPTDGQTHAQASIFGREELVEKTREMFRIDARAAVLDGAAHRPRVRKHCSDGDAALRRRKLRHRLDCIDGQVDNDLLKLNSVSRNLRALGRKIKGHDDPFGLQLMTQEA